MEDELTTYLALDFDDSDAEQLKRERAALLRLEGGAIRARMSESRGRCGKIWNIYVRYLTPWFDRVLRPDQREQLSGLFRELSAIDSHMVDAIDEIATWLTAEASETGDLMEQNALTEANERIRSARRQIPHCANASRKR